MSIELQLSGFDETIEMLDNVVILDGLANMVKIVSGRFGVEVALLTPVVTGAMQRAWTTRSSGLEGLVFIDPSAVNPRSGIPVKQYAPAVCERVGIVDAVMLASGRIITEAFGEVQWVAKR